MLAFRQHIVTNDDPNFQELLNFQDFYSTSALRDLLFHIQEHRFTIPMIKKALKELNLVFLGFDFGDTQVKNIFRNNFSQSNAEYNLDMWHEFEMSNPSTFASMYQFWVQKQQAFK